MNAPGETLYADPALLERWREKGGKPPVVTYARGPALDPGNATAQLVRGWIEAGIVETVKEREQGGVLLHAVRLKESGRPPFGGGGGPANAACGVMPGGAVEDGLTARERRVLEFVRGVCRSGGGKAAELPGSTTIAERCQIYRDGLPDRRRANNIVKKFAKLGLVKLEPVAGGGRRAILTDNTTSPTATKAPGMTAPQGTALAEPLPLGRRPTA